MNTTNLLPPNSFNLECTLLKELIFYPQNISYLIRMLNDDLFSSDDTKKFYSILKGMHERGEQIDLVSISNRVDMAFFSANIINREIAYSPESIEAHCQQLRSIALKRKAFYMGMEMMAKANDAMATDEEILNLPIQIEEGLSKSVIKSTTKKLDVVLKELEDKLKSGDTKRIPTSIPQLDLLTYGGFAQGALIILAARPSVGKTAIMLQMAKEAASRGIPTLALSLEMTNVELAQRILFSTDKITQRDLMLNDVNWNSFDDAITACIDENLYLDETPQTIDDVCANIAINHQRGKCDIAYVDYLQLMSAPNDGDSLYKQVTGITKKMKKLAKSLKIPIVLLCQLNRNSVSQNRSPQLHDLRDSGSIEQDADMVLMLERVYEDMAGEQVLTNKINLWVRKNRGGEGTDIKIPLEASSCYTKFTEINENKPF